MRTDGNADIWAEHSFSIISVDVNDSKVSSKLPVVWPMMRIGSYTVERVEISVVAGVDGTSAKVGDKNVLLWEIKLDNSASEKSVKVKSITVRNKGTADVTANLTNLALFNNSKKVSTDVVVSGRDVTFTVNADIEDGKSENFQIRADVISAERSTETYEFEIRNSTDLLVTEIATGFSSPIKNVGDVDFTSKELGEVTVEGGDLLLSRDSSVSSSQTVSPSSSDVVLWAANLNVTEAITLEDLTIDTSGFDDTKVNNLRLVIGGTTVATITPSADVNTQKFEFTTTVKSNTTIKVLANLKSNATDTMNIGSIDNSKFGLVEYVSNGEAASIIGSVSASEVSVGTPSILVTRNDSKVDGDKVISGAKDVEVYAFSLRANDVSDMKVTSLKFEDLVWAVSSSYITNVRLYKGTELLSTRNNFDFTTLDITIPKNTSVSFKVLVDFSSSVVDGAEFQLNLVAGQNVRSIVDNVQRAINVANSQWAILEFDEKWSTVVKVNSSTAVSSIVTPGALRDVFSFDVEAKDDTLKVSDVYLKATQTLNAAVKSATMVVDGKTINGDFIAGDVLYFSIGDTEAIKITPDTVKTFKVNLEFHDFNTSTRSGLPIQLGLAQAAELVASSVTPRNGTSNGLRVVSDSNGDFVTNTTATVDSRAHVLARSKVTVADASFTPSTTDVYKFTVTADANRKVTLGDLAVKISGSADLTSGTVSVYRDNNSGNSNLLGTYAIQAWDLDSDGKLTTDIVVDLASETASPEVAAGSTVTYYVVLTGLTANNVDKTREVNVTGLEFVDDITGASAIETATYNVGVPTKVSTYKY